MCNPHDRIFHLSAALMFFVTNAHLMKRDALSDCFHTISPSSLLLIGVTGWVSYAISAINSAIGENKLMPGADTPCTVINAENGQSRGNGSWVLGRAMRDFCGPINESRGRGGEVRRLL